jgi:hypothetical protein
MDTSFFLGLLEKRHLSVTSKEVLKPMGNDENQALPIVSCNTTTKHRSYK